jgi:cytochrome oxidase Cu insertion factor (SCO1/SenC/PrrC family)
MLAALAFGIALGAGVALLHGSGKSEASGVSTLPGRPAASWAPKKQRAPGFSLEDERGAPISLRAYRGRPVIVTFIDPACTSLCPLEAQELNRAEAMMPAAKRVGIIAVSVNPPADSRANFRKDAKKWRLVPQWHWAVGPSARLARVWKSYKIGVLTTKRVIAGKTVRDVSHTEAAFVVDGAGYERALFLWPFLGPDVARTVTQLLAGSS